MVQLILSMSKVIGVPGYLLLAICTHESGLNNTLIPHDGGSPTYGVCQVKFNTAKMLGFSGKPKQLMNPLINIKFAAKYLKRQINRYDGNLCKATAAYNAGRYNPSSLFPGKPKNFRYVKSVTLLIDNNYKESLLCKETVAMK